MPASTQKPSILIPALWLVVFTYIAFGWYWHSLVEELHRFPVFHEFPVLFWPFILLVNLMLISLCTAPRSLVNPRILSWFDSSLFSFVFIIFASVISVLVLTHVNALATLIILGTALGIARLDLQIRAYSIAQSWILLLLAAVIGGSIGISAHAWHHKAHAEVERSQLPMIIQLQQQHDRLTVPFFLADQSQSLEPIAIPSISL